MRAASEPAKMMAETTLIRAAVQTFHFLSSPSAPHRESHTRSVWVVVLPGVSQRLGPADQAQGHEDLRLHLERDVEVLDNRVGTEGDAT